MKRYICSEVVKGATHRQEWIALPGTIKKS